jgi:hypothetical protein
MGVERQYEGGNWKRERCEGAVEKNKIVERR